MRYLMGFLILIVCVLPLSAQEQAAPALDAGKVDFTLSPLRISKLQATKFIYTTVRTTNARAGQIFGQKLGELSQAIAAGDFMPSGAPIMVYQSSGAQGGPNVSLQIGYPIYMASQPVPGYTVGSLESKRTATTVFMGSMQQIGSAFQQIDKDLAANGWKSTGERRERYLYWESVNSPNNVVLIEMALND